MKAKLISPVDQVGKSAKKMKMPRKMKSGRGMKGY